MDNEYLTTGQSKFYLNEDILTKVSNSHAWGYDIYKIYLKFAKTHRYCVPVTAWKSNYEIQMKKLDIDVSVDDMLQYAGYDLHPKVTKEKIHRVILFYQQIQIDFLKFSIKHLPQGKYFYHTDLHLLNLVFTTDDDLMLIDPNSFQLTKHVVNTEYVSHFNRLMWRAHMTMERLKNV